MSVSHKETEELIEEVDNEVLNQVYAKIQQAQDNEEEEDDIVPTDRLSARSWVLSYVRLEEEVEFLENEYITELKKKYIEPVEDKIIQHKKSQDFIKYILLKFLNNIDRDNAQFPDLRTVSKKKSTDKVVYPSDEKDFARNVFENDPEKKDFIKLTFGLDKAKIKEYYKENGEYPFNEITTEKTTESISFRKPTAKKKKEK